MWSVNEVTHFVCSESETRAAECWLALWLAGSSKVCSLGKSPPWALRAREWRERERRARRATPTFKSTHHLPHELAHPRRTNSFGQMWVRRLVLLYLKLHELSLYSEGNAQNWIYLLVCRWEKERQRLTSHYRAPSQSTFLPRIIGIGWRTTSEQGCHWL